MRRTLPQRRAAETFDLRFWNQSFTVTIGFYADGTPGEVFIDGGKTGQDIQSTARDAAVVLSLALQHGIPIEAIRHAVTRSGSGEAASILGAIVDRRQRLPPATSTEAQRMSSRPIQAIPRPAATIEEAGGSRRPHHASRSHVLRTLPPPTTPHQAHQPGRDRSDGAP